MVIMQTNTTLMASSPWAFIYHLGRSTEFTVWGLEGNVVLGSDPVLLATDRWYLL